MPAKPWAVAGNVEYDPGDARRLSSVLMHQAGTGIRFGARSGVHPAGGSAVTISGFTAAVADLKGVIFTAIDTQIGPYTVAIPSQSHTIVPADSAAPRLDIIYMRVLDQDKDFSGLYQADTVYVPGLASSTPVEPVVPPGVIGQRIATISVPASGNPSVTWNAPFVVALGGILPVRSEAELPATGLYPGMYADDLSLQRLLRYSGTTWQEVARVPTLISGGAVAAAGFSILGMRAKIHTGPLATGLLSVTRTGANVQAGSTGNISPDLAVATLPATLWPRATHFTSCGDGVGSGEVSITSNGVVELRSWSAGGSLDNGFNLRIPFTYEVN